MVVIIIYLSIDGMIYLIKFIFKTKEYLPAVCRNTKMIFRYTEYDYISYIYPEDVFRAVWGGPCNPLYTLNVLLYSEKECKQLTSQKREIHHLKDLEFC